MKCKHEKKAFAKKSVALLLALLLLAGGIVGGTLAWLLDDTTPVVNTFSPSNIEIELTEAGAPDGKQSFKMVPGWTIAKAPLVTVKDGSEDCYVFVKIEKSANYSEYLAEYEVDSVWTKLKDGVYYTTVTGLTADGNDGNWSKYVLKGEHNKIGCPEDANCTCENANGYVSVLTTVEADDMAKLETESDYPTLEFTAYACQLYKTNGVKFTAAEAWANINP